MNRPERRFIHGGGGVPASRAGISHGVVVGGTCYIGGQLSLDENGAYIPGDVESEARRAFANLFAVCDRAGFDRAQIVFLEIALADIGDLPTVSGLYNELFADPATRPPRAVHEVGKLPLNARIRVHGIAARGDGP